MLCIGISVKVISYVFESIFCYGGLCISLLDNLVGKGGIGPQAPSGALKLL